MLYNGINQVPLTATRFASDGCKLFIGKIAPGHWQCVVRQDGRDAATGPISKTKMEAFSVLPSVADQWGIKSI